MHTKAKARGKAKEMLKIRKVVVRCFKYANNPKILRTFAKFLQCQVEALSFVLDGQEQQQEEEEELEWWFTMLRGRVESPNAKQWHTIIQLWSKVFNTLNVVVVVVVAVAVLLSVVAVAEVIMEMCVAMARWKYLAIGILIRALLVARGHGCVSSLCRQCLKFLNNCLNRNVGEMSKRRFKWK